MAATDEALVRQALHGRQDAFAELYRRRGSLVRALCYDRSKDPHVAADLTQEVFMRAYGRLGSLRRPSLFAAWLVGITRQVCREWRRGQHRQRRHLAEFSIRPRHPEALAADDAGRAAALRDAIAALPEKHRLALHAFYLQEQDVEQACRTTGLSRSGLYHVLGVARQRLRRMLEQED